MLLNSPFFISSRLLPALSVGDATIQLEYSRNPGRDGRTRYTWTIDLPDSKSFTASDLQSGAGGGDLKEGFISLLSFLSACGESFAYRGFDGAACGPSLTESDGENSDLFPLEVAEWAAANQDEIAMARFEIEESEEELIEE